MDIKTIVCAVVALIFGVMWYSSNSDVASLKKKYKKKMNNSHARLVLNNSATSKSKKNIKKEETKRAIAFEDKKEELNKEFDAKRRSSKFWKNQNDENRDYHIKKLNEFKDIHVGLNKKFSTLFEESLDDRKFELSSLYYEACLALYPKLAINKIRLSQLEKHRMTNRLGMAFRKIYADEFKMGAKPSERGKSTDEFWHKVKLTYDFYMMETEVTQEMFDAVMNTSEGMIRKRKQIKTRSKHFGPQRPVENVSHDEVKTFITKLNSLSMGTYRLPTEAEWEFSARAGYYKEAYGEFSTPGPTDWYSKNSDGATHDVAKRTPNAYGLYDMLGNVSEWVSDGYGAYPRGSTLVNPTGPEDGKSMVFRGGAFNSTDAKARVAKRNKEVSGERSSSLGFRLILDRQ